MRPSHAVGYHRHHQPSTVVSHHLRFAIYREVVWGMVCAVRGATGAVLGEATGAVGDATSTFLGEANWAVVGSDGAREERGDELRWLHLLWCGRG
jgi:hypothetical protein